MILGWTFFQIIRTAQLNEATNEATNVDAIIVLGAAEYAGKPSPVFQARLNHAKELFEKGFAPLIITTGGTYPGEKISEGEVGRKYLERRGIPAEKIIAETQSLTTKQNLMRVKDIARDKKIERVILVSDPFHMYRSVKIAEDLGFTALSSPTRERPKSQNKWLEMQYIGREMGLVILHEFFDI